MTEFTLIGHLPSKKGHALQDKPSVRLPSTRLEWQSCLSNQARIKTRSQGDSPGEALNRQFSPATTRC